MKVPRRAPRGHALDGDTMTPMIDVVFLLLVFFICASVGGTADRLLPADLSGNSSNAAEARPVNQPDNWQRPVISVEIAPAADGVAISLNQQPLRDAAELSDRLTRLAAADSGARIVIDVDDDVGAQHFITIYDRCQLLKFESISIAVRTPP